MDKKRADPEHIGYRSIREAKTWNKRDPAHHEHERHAEAVQVFDRSSEEIEAMIVPSRLFCKDPLQGTLIRTSLIGNLQSLPA